MASIFGNIREIAQKRMAYARTVADIRAMSLEVALDLEIYRPDAHKIARKAVYGV